MVLLARFLVVLTALLPLACTAAETPKYELGTHYKQLGNPQPTSDPNKIEVMEVFAYSCPHCYHFDPEIQKWLKTKPADVNFVRLPHTLGQNANVVRNKGFYVAQMLGVFDKFHSALFDAIHKANQPVATPEELRDFFDKKLGVPAKDFDAAYGSFAVDAGVRRGEQQLKDMAVASVPQLVIEGRYYTTPRAGGGFDEMLKVTDWLVEQARAQRKTAKPAKK